MNFVRTPDGKGMPMDYHHISGFFPLDFTMHKMSFIDPTGRAINIGEVHVQMSLSNLVRGNIQVDKVTLTDSTAMATQGSGYIEDNALYTDNERKQAEHQSAKMSKGTVWPTFPYAITVASLEIINMSNPLMPDYPLSIKGSLSFGAQGGSFSVSMTIDDGGHFVDISLDAKGQHMTHVIQATVEMRNSSLTCFAADWATTTCKWPVSLRTAFPSENQLFSLSTRSNIRAVVEGEWGSLLQVAFPSKHWNGTKDLVSGVLTADALDDRPLVSRAMTQFRVSSRSALILDEARLTSSVFHHRDSSVSLAAQLPIRAKSLHEFLGELNVTLPVQRMTLPLPIGTIDLAIQANQTSFGDWSMAKYDSVGSYVQWTSGSRFTLDVKNSLQFHMENITIDAFLGHMNGTASMHYTKSTGFNFNCSMYDPDLDLIATVSVAPYLAVASDGTATTRYHHLMIEANEPRLVFDKRLEVNNVTVTASVLGLPSQPYGGISIGVGRINYDNGAFVMDNMLMGASRAEEASDDTPWEFTASSDRDLRTRLTLYLIGNGDNEFSGSLAPFEARIYGGHRVWTTRNSDFRFDYQRQQFSMHSIFHANELEPERNSLDINVETDRYRLIVNDESYLLDPLLLKSSEMRSRGLMQGYIELVRGQNAPDSQRSSTGAFSLGSLDMCWNDGAVEKYQSSSKSWTPMVKNVHGCIQGTPQEGWSIKNPSATAWVENPRMGSIELRGNITAVRDEELAPGQLLIPAELEMRMRNDDQNQWIGNGWLYTQLMLSMNV
jgi:hypothetical protein